MSLIVINLIFRQNSRNGSPLVRTPSPRRRSHLHPQHDIGFSDTVSNVVEIVKEDFKHRGYRSNGRHPRGMFTIFISKYAPVSHSHTHTHTHIHLHRHRPCRTWTTTLLNYNTIDKTENGGAIRMTEQSTLDVVTIPRPLRLFRLADGRPTKNTQKFTIVRENHWP